MKRVDGPTPRPKTGKALGCLIAAALLFAGSIALPDAANAEHGGGGGAHAGGGGFHGGGGGFHRGGSHAGGSHTGGFRSGFHGGGFRGGGFHSRGFHDGFGGLHRGLAVGLGGIYAPFAWDYYYPYAGYPDYGYEQPYPAQYWYYCSDPAGYYPYVTQCNTGWQTVPAS